MNVNLNDLKIELQKDFGKLSCWQWLCEQERAKTDQDKAILARKVLEMPSMGNIAASQTFMLLRQGKQPQNIDD